MSSSTVVGVAFALMLVAGLAMVAPYAIESSVEESETDYNVTKEEFTPQAGTIQSLDNSHIDGADYSDTVRVFDENGNLTTTSDYRWHESNGTIEPLVGGALDGDDNASISYDWTGQTKEQARTTDIVYRSAEIWKGFALLAGVALMLMAVIVFLGAL